MSWHVGGLEAVFSVHYLWKLSTSLCSLRKGESLRTLLDDKQHIAEQKARYQAYETVVDEVLVGPGEPGASGSAFLLDDYDDEYDDTYDNSQVGANDLDDDDDLLNRR